MRVSAAGALQADETIIALHLSDKQLDALFDGLADGFLLDHQKPVRVSGASIAKFDAFFEGTGHFSAFDPCNQWVNRVLTHAGFQLGIWTPTTQSLRRSIEFFNSD